MVPALACFVAAICWLQQAQALPGGGAMAALVATAAALAGAAWQVRIRHRLLATVGACAASALLGLDYAAWIAHQRLADELSFADEGRDVVVTGIVASLPSRIEQGVRFAFEVERAEPSTVHVPRLIMLSWYQEPDGVRPAQRWRLTAKLRRPHGTFNPAGFDGELWMLEQGVRATGYVREGAGHAAPACLQQAVWRLNPMVDRARDALRERLQQALAQRRYGGVIVALVMGDQGLIAQADWTLFNRTGISHLVSISGLHITMIAGLVALAAGAAWRASRRLLAVAPVQTVRAVAGTLGGLGYCLLAGWGVPAQRTFVMLATVAAALVLRVRLGAATILAAAAVAVCVWDPWAVTAAGFWLSFGAVASIFMVCHGRVLAAGSDRWGQALREALRVQAAVTIGLVPLTLVLFQQVSLISPLANAIAIPLVSYLVTPLALLGALLCCLGGALQPLAQPLLLASHALFEVLARVLDWLVQLPWAWASFAAPPAWSVAVAAVGIAWLLAPAGWPMRWAGAAWLVPAFVMPPERPPQGGLWVTALDVGQGMALVLETRDRTLVFDTGPRISADADAGARIVVPYLRARGIDRVDTLVVSHLDADHSGGARSLIDAVRVGSVLTSVDPDLPLLAGAGDVQRCESGQQRDLGPLRLTVLSPPAPLYEQPRATTNARSCVVMAALGSTRVLLTGDVPARQEAAMAGAFAGSLRAQLMVAPHHGSKTSSSEVLVDAVRPQWVSVQAGYRSRFGHPHPEVLARYQRHGARVVRSDWSGAARWRFGADGSVRLEQWRRDHARYWLNRPDGSVNSQPD